MIHWMLEAGAQMTRVMARGRREGGNLDGNMKNVYLWWIRWDTANKYNIAETQPPNCHIYIKRDFVLL